MLHPLNPPDSRCENDLFSLIDWQRKTLTYARDHAQFHINTFRPFMGDAFTDWFEDSRLNGQQKGQKDAFNKFRVNLSSLTQCDLHDKQAVLDDFEHDLDFYFHLNNPDFIFAFSPKVSAAHENAKFCLNAFYQFLSWEFPAALVASGQKFHRQDIVQSYLEQNPILSAVCPCCDNSWPEPTSTNGTPYTLEHFFHKEEHATICLHPYNLVPICSVCNGRRGNKEMLCPTGNADVPINQIFHPIERPVRKYAQLEFRSQQLEPETMYFANSSTRTDEWPTAIETYNVIYGIPTRWQGRWSQIQMTVSNAIRYALQGLLSTNGSITQDQFERELDKIVKTLLPNIERQDEKEKKNISLYGQYQYPAGRWLIWAKTYYLDELYKAHVEPRNMRF